MVCSLFMDILKDRWQADKLAPNNRQGTSPSKLEGGQAEAAVALARWGALVLGQGVPVDPGNVVLGMEPVVASKLLYSSCSVSSSSLSYDLREDTFLCPVT